MIAPVLALCFLGQAVLPQMAPDDLWSFFEKTGYRIDKGPQSMLGKITAQGIETDVSFMVGPGDTPLYRRQVMTIYLRYRYMPMKRVTPQFTQGWQADQRRSGADTVSLSARLSGVIQAESSIPMGKGLTDRQLEARVKSFTESIQKLREDIPEGKPDAPQFKVDEDLRVDALDGEDTRYLAEAWGWKYNGGWGMSGPTWVQPIQIDGMLIFAGGVHPGMLIRDRIQVNVRADLQLKGDLEKAKADIQKKLRDTTVSADGRSVGFRREIDMSGGIALKDLKQKVLEFAKQVAPWVKGNQGLVAR